MFYFALSLLCLVFFFTDPSTTEIYTLSLHDALPICWDDVLGTVQVTTPDRSMDMLLNRWLLYQTLACRVWARSAFYQARSEEHTSELQSHSDLVCRLLLEKKKKKKNENSKRS